MSKPCPECGVQAFEIDREYAIVGMCKDCRVVFVITPAMEITVYTDSVIVVPRAFRRR